MTRASHMDFSAELAPPFDPDLPGHLARLTQFNTAEQTELAQERVAVFMSNASSLPNAHKLLWPYASLNNATNGTFAEVMVILLVVGGVAFLRWLWQMYLAGQIKSYEKKIRKTDKNAAISDTDIDKNVIVPTTKGKMTYWFVYLLGGIAVMIITLATTDDKGSLFYVKMNRQGLGFMSVWLFMIAQALLGIAMYNIPFDTEWVAFSSIRWLMGRFNDYFLFLIGFVLNEHSTQYQGTAQFLFVISATMFMLAAVFSATLGFWCKFSTSSGAPAMMTGLKNRLWIEFVTDTVTVASVIVGVWAAVKARDDFPIARLFLVDGSDSRIVPFIGLMTLSFVAVSTGLWAIWHAVAIRLKLMASGRKSSKKSASSGHRNNGGKNKEKRGFQVKRHADDDE